jgi:hypothetical protein
VRSGRTNAALAAELGVSERHLYRILHRGTTSRDLAKRVARAKNSESEEYLCGPKRKGRRRAHSFREYVESLDDDANGGKLAKLLDHFVMQYTMARRDAPPGDFYSLEELTSYVRNAGIKCRADAVPLAWKRFRIWRVERKAAEEIFAIEMEDDLA